MRRSIVVTTLLVLGIVACSAAEPSSEHTNAASQADSVPVQPESLEDTDEDLPSAPPTTSGNHAAGDVPNGPTGGGCTTCAGDPQEVTVHGEPRQPPRDPGGSAGSDPGSADPGQDPNMPRKPECGVPGTPPCPDKKGCYDSLGNQISTRPCADLDPFGLCGKDTEVGYCNAKGTYPCWYLCLSGTKCKRDFRCSIRGKEYWCPPEAWCSE